MKPKYLDESLSVKERAKDLVAQMTLEEKASQLRYDAPAIDRLGVPAYNWWNEALHGVARAGTATVFPQAIGMAAMFDDEGLKEIAEIISTEARAKYNMQAAKGDRDIYKGLTIWSPNVNIFRDPRWGRGHETYGEDPYLTSRLGVKFVEGLQGDGEVLKTAACAKHYAVHSGPEGIRHEFDAISTEKDLWETYLPAFEALVKEAKVESVMGAYNRTNGEPCCGSKLLLHDILREKWGFDGHVVSDCWAIRDFHTNHKVTATAPESAALAMKWGCDVNCGNTYLHMLQAYEEGLVTEEQITTACERLFTTRMRLGMFNEHTEYDDIPYEVNDCAEHAAANLKTAEKSMVLLKNNGVLPLDKNKIKTIAVIGPNADNQEVLKGNYSGTASRYVTLLEGIQQAVNPDTRVYYSQGCHLFKNRVEELGQPNDRIAEAIAVAERSDVVILCLGLDATIEGEQGDAGNAYAAGDKVTLDLSPEQEGLIKDITKLGKPTILLLSTGSAMSINYANEHCDAIIETWYPGALGGVAAANILFGEVSPSGKLPVTFYKGVDELPEFTDYNMKGRTYRYMDHEALYPFGFGLSYSKAEYSDLKVPASVGKEDDFTISVAVSNTGNYDMDEVVEVYIKDNESKFAVPNHSLCAFKRIALKKGESKVVEIPVKNMALTVVDDKGDRYVDSGKFTLYVGGSQPDARSVALMGAAPLTAELTVQ